MYTSIFLDLWVCSNTYMPFICIWCQVLLLLFESLHTSTRSSFTWGPRNCTNNSWLMSVSKMSKWILEEKAYFLSWSFNLLLYLEDCNSLKVIFKISTKFSAIIECYRYPYSKCTHKSMQCTGPVLWNCKIGCILWPTPFGFMNCET